MKAHIVTPSGLESDSSPRHAVAVLVSGPVTKNMRGALESVHKATSDPKWVVAVGECACTGGIFLDSYACVGAESEVLPVDLKIRGCPPRPIEILGGLLAMLQKSVGALT